MLRRTEELETTSNSKGEVEAVNKFCANSIWRAGRFLDPSPLPQIARQKSLFHPSKTRLLSEEEKKKKVQQKGRKPALSRKPEGSAILTVRVK